jgi:hypothetical protein
VLSPLRVISKAGIGSIFGIVNQNISNTYASMAADPMAIDMAVALHDWNALKWDDARWTSASVTQLIGNLDLRPNAGRRDPTALSESTMAMFSPKGFSGISLLPLKGLCYLLVDEAHFTYRVRQTISMHPLAPLLCKTTSPSPSVVGRLDLLDS